MRLSGLDDYRFPDLYTGTTRFVYVLYPRLSLPATPTPFLRIMVSTRRSATSSAVQGNPKASSGVHSDLSLGSQLLQRLPRRDRYSEAAANICTEAVAPVPSNKPMSADAGPGQLSRENHERLMEATRTILECVGVDARMHMCTLARACTRRLH